jgi:site-specific DNA recombinase
MHAVKLERKLRDWQVGLHSITEQIDTTTAPGRFNFRNIASASELERDMIKARTQMGLRGMAAEKKWPNDSPPLGYRRKEEGTLQIVEEEAELVQFIFNRYIELKSMPEVAEELNSKEKNQRSKEWTAYAVGEILKEELYIGQYSLANVEEYIDEYHIIDEELFDRATEVRTRFQGDNKAKRAEMPEERKKRRISKVMEQYRQFLDS